MVSGGAMVRVEIEERRRLCVETLCALPAVIRLIVSLPIRQLISILRLPLRGSFRRQEPLRERVSPRIR